MRKLIVIALISTILPNLNAQNGYQVSEKFVDVSLPNASNTMNGVDMAVSLSDYNNAKGYIIVFTSNVCPFSQAYESRIIALHKKYAMRGYPVIAVNSERENFNVDESFGEMKLRAKEKNYPFAYLQDTTQNVAMSFGATHTTQAIVIQKKKDKNIIRYIGAVDDNTWKAAEVSTQYVADVVDKLLVGELPTLKSIPSQGCEILWKKEFVEELSAADAFPTKKRRRN